MKENARAVEVLVKSQDLTSSMTLAPQALADIVVIDGSEYEINFYHSAEIGEIDGSGLYPVAGLTPFVTWRIRNPDAGDNVFERLQIIREQGAGSDVNEFSWEENGGTETWRLDRGSGLEIAEVTYSPPVDDDILRSTVIKNAEGKVATAFTENLHNFDFGIRRTWKEDASGITEWIYFEEGPNEGRLKEVLYPSGAWERYSYDSNGVRTKTVTPFKDSPITSINDADHRVLEVFREIVDLNTDGHLDERITTIETTLGIETSRHHSISWGGTAEADSQPVRSQWEIQPVTAGANWNTSSNLVTKTWIHAGGDFAGEPHSVRYPDGTAVLFSYSHDEILGGRRTVQETGEPVVDGNGYVTSISDGTAIETVTGEFGQTYLRRTSDIVTGVIFDEHFSSPESDFDELGRVTKITYLDGTTTVRQYACCSLASETDREDVTTVYSPDALGRIIASTRNGITVSYKLDAAGRRTKTTRTGTDATDIVQNISEYDTAGRLIFSHDAATGPVSISYEDGGARRRTAYADGSERIEEFFLDGNLKASWHAADPEDPAPDAPSHRREYDYGVHSSYGSWTQETRIGPGGATSEWTKTFTDIAGRRHRIESSAGLIEQHIFDAATGRRIRIQRGGWPNPVTLFSYNNLGELEHTVVDGGSDGVRAKHVTFCDSDSDEREREGH